MGRSTFLGALGHCAINYFELHIGDYEKATSHLSACEDGIYGRLMRRYYDTEAPLPADLKAVQRFVRAKSRDEKEAVETILGEFFTLQADGWHHKRCDEEIARFAEKREKAKRSANARWSQCDGDANASTRVGEPAAESVSIIYDTAQQQNMTASAIVDGKPLKSNKSDHTNASANAMRTHCEGNALQAPDSSKSKININNGVASQPKGARSSIALPDWLSPEVWGEWHQFRNSRKGWTPRARELSLATLGRLRSLGHDPKSIVEQSIERGWTGLFELKSEATHANGTSSRKLSAVEQVEAAIRQRRAREADASPLALT